MPHPEWTAISITYCIPLFLPPNSGWPWPGVLLAEEADLNMAQNKKNPATDDFVRECRPRKVAGRGAQSQQRFGYVGSTVDESPGDMGFLATGEASQCDADTPVTFD
jgi:hypothetical protein